MPWIIVSHPPLVATLNWCGEKCATKVLQNWKHKTWPVSQYNVSLMVMGWIPPKGLVMAKRWAALRVCAIQRGMWPCAIWKQSSNDCGNPLAESSRWKQTQRCLKTILERPFVDNFGMCWNVSLKESNESSRS
jgi:hypothetical protein